jgi:hypothetical protein
VNDCGVVGAVAVQLAQQALRAVVGVARAAGDGLAEQALAAVAGRHADSPPAVLSGDSAERISPRWFSWAISTSRSTSRT